MVIFDGPTDDNSKFKVKGHTYPNSLLGMFVLTHHNSPSFLILIGHDIVDGIQTLSMPPPGEQLYMTTDEATTGLGATLHRSKNKEIVRNFSKQLSEDKKLWLPCELEALAVGAGL